jgi:hypothetical protein
LKYVKLFEEFVAEGIFLTYNQMSPYEYNKFVEAYKELHKDNHVVHDKKNDMTYGFRKGSTEAHWKYDHDTYKIQHSEKDRDVLGLIHGKKMVSKDHPWSK